MQRDGMKHTTTMTAAVLALMLNLTGCDGPSPEAGSRPSDGAVERIKALLGMESAEPATADDLLAVVRGCVAGGVDAEVELKRAVRALAESFTAKADKS